jgi:hypothetical protein
MIIIVMNAWMSEGRDELPQVRLWLTLEEGSGKLE